MNKLKSTQKKPKYYAVLNSQGYVQGIVLADNRLEDSFLECIRDCYDVEYVEVKEGYEVGPYEFKFNVFVFVNHSHGESFEFQMVKIYQ